MKKILLLLTLSTTLLLALPPEVKRDQYLKGLSKAYKAKDYVKAETYFSKLDALVTEHKVKLPSSYFYFKADTFLKNNKMLKAYTYAEKYVENSNSKGKYYSQALEILDESEELAIKIKALLKLKPIVDSSTSLMWQDGRIIFMIWREAKNYCENLVITGYRDWRLPNYYELLSIVDYSKYNPATSIQFANDFSRGYWTSSEYAADSSKAWKVNFKDGYVYDNAKSNSNYVRCVRGR